MIYVPYYYQPRRPRPTTNREVSDICVVPQYRDLFGEPAKLDDLLTIVRKYPVFTWLSMLSRLHTLLAPPHELDLERHRAAFGGLVGPTVANRFRAFEEEHKAPCLTFVDPQIAVLQQLAILHAPEGPNIEELSSDDHDQISTALLMTWDLMEEHPAENGPDEVTAALAQATLRRAYDWSPALAVRAFYAYQLEAPAANEPVRKLRGYFERATGVSLSDHILGGVALALIEETRSPEELAHGWTPCGPASPRKDPLIGDPVEAFLKVRCGSLSQIKEEIQRLEHDREVSDYSCIALGRYPVITFGGDKYILSIPRVADAMFEGVRHAIQTASLDGVPGIPDLETIGGVFGEVFEEYVHDLLDKAFPDRLIRLPRAETQGRRRADGLVAYPERVIVYEVKSKHARAVDRRTRLSVAERREELKKVGVDQAAWQIAHTIEDLRAGKIDDRRLRHYDWTCTQIVPVIITAESIPLSWNMWPVIEDLMGPITTLPMQNQITRPRILDIGDAERLPDLAEIKNVGLELATWAHHPTMHGRPLGHYLHDQRIAIGKRFLGDRYAQVLVALGDRCGLDTSKLDFLARAAKAR